MNLCRLACTSGILAVIATTAAAASYGPPDDYSDSDDFILDAGYSHLDHGGGNEWAVDGAALFHVSDTTSLNVAAGYGDVSGIGANANAWQASGSVVFETTHWRFGPTSSVSDTRQGHSDDTVWNLGGFAEFYPTRRWTLDLNVGGLKDTASAGGSDGYYGGGGITGYVTPNVNIGAGAEYTHFTAGGDEADFSTALSWRPFAATPLSFWGGYQYSTFSPGSTSVNLIAAGVRFDLGNSGSLYETNRSGALIDQVGFAP